MKPVLLIFCCSIIVLIFSHSTANSGKSKQHIIDSTAVEITDFKTVIQPILQKNCSPCHFPGGKMYEKMPFDKPQTIVNNAVGALKRFRNKNEKELLQQFIEEEKLR